MEIGIRRAPITLRETGAKVWDDSLRWLQEQGLLETVDYPLLQSYCFAIEIVQEAEMKLLTEGITIEHTNKAEATNTQAHPSITTYKHFYDIIERCSKKFGFNPSDRAKLPIKKEKKKRFGNMSRNAS